MIYRTIIILSIFSFTMGFSGMAQVIAPGADFSDTAAYSVPGGPDSVFVFNTPGFGESATAGITAVSPDSSYGWNFEWSKYDTVSMTYTVFSSDTGMFSSIDTITTQAGYRVRMTKGLQDLTFRVWVLMNDYNVDITNKDMSGNVAFGNYGCGWLDLKAAMTTKNLKYKVPGLDSTIILNDYYNIHWTADPDTSPLPLGKLNARVLDPSAVDTRYYINVDDRFGAHREDDVLYVSIESDARITDKYIPLSDAEFYPQFVDKPYYSSSQYDQQQSAPAAFQFLNNSINAANYQWYFGDGKELNSQAGESEIKHVYLLPGAYTVTLITTSAAPYNCVDSVKKELTVSKPELQVPNVFTPNGDGINDIFRVYDVSITDFHIIIYDRYGEKVHEFRGDIRNWQGWDGKINNSDSKAADGVYYYVISKASAIEDWTTNKPADLNKQQDSGSGSGTESTSQDVYKGFIHLYRGNSK